jgi:cytochrome c peroxidase
MRHSTRYSLLAAVIALGFIRLVGAVPLGLPQVTATTDNAYDRDKVTLGARLFQDKRFSANRSISCASCHQPSAAFTDHRKVAEGIAHRQGTRNTPTVLNVAFQETLFWDGRRTTLELQAADPLTNPKEHGLADTNAVLDVIRHDPRYVASFKAVFHLPPTEISVQHVVMAIASFERTLLAGDSPFDRYQYGQDKTALSAEAVRGLALFRGRAQCQTCHLVGEHTALFTDLDFHSLGIGLKDIASRLGALTSRVVQTDPNKLDRLVSSQPELAELGRFLVSRSPKDIGRFKTPSLRNVALTPPYMHDGSVKTLAEAIDREVYYRGIESNHPLVLTPAEKSDLVEFLKSLTSTTYEQAGSVVSFSSQSAAASPSSKGTVRYGRLRSALTPSP